MMMQIALQILMLLTPLTQSSTVPLRTRDVARQLSKEDVAAIERTLPADAKPWLLNGESGQVVLLEYIEAYLSTTETTPALRRGTVITVMRRTRPPEPVGEWNVSRTESYAQVAISGRSFDDVSRDPWTSLAGIPRQNFG